MRRKLRAISRYRPRVLTLAILLAVGTLLVLANLSDDFRPRRIALPEDAALSTVNSKDWRFDVREPEAGDASADPADPMWNLSFGWPLLWNQYIAVYGYGTAVVGWRYSLSRLAADVAIWLVMLTTPAAACEWLLRRYRPRWHWSLRTMLAAVGLLAACCGWFVYARDRANMEDALIDVIQQWHGQVWLERWGPNWLDLIGADRYRRRIVAASLVIGVIAGEQDQQAVRGLLHQLSQRPGLRYLNLNTRELTPEVAGALIDFAELHALSIDNAWLPEGAAETLGESLHRMPRLRSLYLSPGARIRRVAPSHAYSFVGNHEQVADNCLAAVAEATQLETLTLSKIALRGDNLARLAPLINLRSLTIISNTVLGGDEPDETVILLGLPALPQLEALHLRGRDFGDDDLHYLTRVPRLHSLELVETEVTGNGLANLAAVPNLQELSLHANVTSSIGLVSSKGLEAFLTVAQLKRLHIDLEYPQPLGAQMTPLVQKGRRILSEFRHTHPDITVDGAWLTTQGIPRQYDTVDRQRTLGVHEAVRQWKKAAGSTTPPAGSGMF